MGKRRVPAAPHGPCCSGLERHTVVHHKVVPCHPAEKGAMVFFYGFLRRSSPPVTSSFLPPSPRRIMAIEPGLRRESSLRATL